MKNIYFGIILLLFLNYSCSSGGGKNSYPYNNDTTNSSSTVEEIAPDEFTLFKNVIDSIYPEIKKVKFDTIGFFVYKTKEELQKHRMVSIIISKNQVKDTDLEKIIGLYSCVIKNDNIKKKDSEDIVIDEYICKSPDDASFWFNQIYNCYYEGKNPLGEPLKEPYKIWQSSDRVIHIYTRAEMWRADMESINKALMKSYLFTKSEK
jgi:hypothetical protein